MHDMATSYWPIAKTVIQVKQFKHDIDQLETATTSSAEKSRGQRSRITNPHFPSTLIEADIVGRNKLCPPLCFHSRQ